MNIAFICAAILFIAAVYFFLIFPSGKKRSLDAFLRFPIAHRGAHGELVCENSIPAFEKAVSLGLPVELDVRRTLDGVPVVFHDESLSRLCGVDKKISEVTLDELRLYTLAKTFERIPTLSEVLEVIDGRVAILIELKGGIDSVLVTECAKLIDKYKGVCAVQSFNPLHLYRIRRLVHGVPLGFLTEKRRVSGLHSKAFVFLSRALAFNYMFRPDFISCRYKDGVNLSVRLARALGARVFMWTVRTPEEARQASKLCDALICENAEEILESINKRKQE